MSREKKPSGRKPLFQLGRQTGDYRRPMGGRQQGKSILIFCEGKRTEPNYFNSIREEKRLSNVRVISGGADRTEPIHLVEKADEHITNMDWNPRSDEAWCVFDVEGVIADRSIQRALTLARRLNIHLAVSNPAFEYWFLLHFEPTSRPFLNGDALKTALCAHIQDYRENMPVYLYLRELTPQALSRCSQLREQADPGWDKHPNPSTSVDFLIQRLLDENEDQNSDRAVG